MVMTIRLGFNPHGLVVADGAVWVAASREPVSAPRELVFTRPGFDDGCACLLSCARSAGLRDLLECSRRAGQDERRKDAKTW